MRWLDSNTDSWDMNLSKLIETGEPGMLVYADAKIQRWLSD